MATLALLTTAIRDIIGDDSIELTDRINEAVSIIAGGIRMPDGQFSSPLPELFESDTVGTTSNAYVDLPATYQRNLFYVADENGSRIDPPRGGSYYSFVLFLNNLSEKDMSQTGSVDRVCAKGRRLYYQGIPTASEDILIYFYRKPVDMNLEDDEPDGLPDHLSKRLIVHYVCKEIFGEGLEDGDNSRAIGAKYHNDKFYMAMIDLLDFIGLDVEPEYYANSEDNYFDLRD